MTLQELREVAAMKMPFGKPFPTGDYVSATRASPPIFSTSRGALFQSDCLEFLPRVRSESVDTVFADPPFNLGKLYGAKVNDAVSEKTYVEWCARWLDECIRILKPGGALFVYNIPKWNIVLGSILNERHMTFRHWIAISIKFGLPIQGRLYPAHYSLLYYTKGKPKTFRSIRTPIALCRHCGKDIKDYGGHRGAMNPKGVNLTDVWDDIPPVRHRKFKSEKRLANQLSTKLLYRVVNISTCPGDLVVDPFGGSGTTFDVCERLERNWLGCDIEDCEAAIARLSGEVENHTYTDYVAPL